MAQLPTQMDGVTGATGQWFVAGLSTGGDGIRAAPPFGVAQLQQLGQRRLAARTRLHQGRGAWARLAWPTVARLLTPVSGTVQHLST